MKPFNLAFQPLIKN